MSRALDKSSLNRTEKAAGKAFRDACAARLAALPGGTALASPYITWFRHDCTGGTSWAMKLRQHYWLSPQYPGVPAGLLAVIFRFGECPRCGLAARSGTGRLVIAARTVMEKGAVREDWHEDRAVPAGQAVHPDSPGLDR